MKETFIRASSGLVYALLFFVALYHELATILLFFVFGLLSIKEFNALIKLKSKLTYIIFIVIYLFSIFGTELLHTNKGFDEFYQILLVLTLFVNLFLIKDLFSEKTIPLFGTKRYILTTFYLSTAFVFIILLTTTSIAHNRHILLGSFLLVWVNDSFAYLVGKNFGKQKLFPSISPKKTFEGFIGGLLFSCIASYFLSVYISDLNFTSWLIISIIISVFGTLGDLIESKFKRQAGVKDSGTIMPGHGGILDRLDSIIFAAPFIYLFLRYLTYVS